MNKRVRLIWNILRTSICPPRDIQMRLRGVALFSALVALSAPAHAEFEQQLGPLANVVRQQMLQGWTGEVQDGWFTLRLSLIHI